jgi:hypothetical protein
VRHRRRPPDPEVERQKAATDSELVALIQHPSWPELEAEVARRSTQIERELLSAIINRPGPVNQSEIDFKRGVLYGLTWIINRPRNAELSLERYLQGELREETSDTRG